MNMNIGDMDFGEMISRTYYGNTLFDYLVVLGALVAGFIVVRVLTAVAVGTLRRWSARTESRLDDFLINVTRRTAVPLLYYGVFYVATRSLVLPAALEKAIEVIGIILLTAMAIRFLTTILVYMVENIWLKREPTDVKAKSFRGLMPAIKVLIWGMGLIFLLDNLGFEISTVIAGLGIGGIAVAMASQAVLGDLFSYFAIIMDRPFEDGDFIIVGDYMGTIEHVGIKTTRVRSLGGEQLVFSNTDLTGSRIKNYKRMERRRIVFSIGVIYQTPLEQLKEIPGILKEVVEKTPDTAFDRAHFKTYGDFSINFETVYYVLSSDYNKYMDTQQAINLALGREFKERGIEFAYPTQTVFLERENAEPAVT